MAKYDDKIMDLAFKCYNELKSMPYCPEVSTRAVVDTVRGRKHVDEGEYWDVHRALSELVKSDGAFIMDFTRYFMACVGLPYNIPYIFRPKHPTGWAIFQHLLRLAQSTEDNDAVNYAKDIVHSTEWESPFMGYFVPIPLNRTFMWLERADKKNCRLKVVPDPEFQEGGMRQDQCDGWSYHYELDFDNPPVIYY